MPTSGQLKALSLALPPVKVPLDGLQVKGGPCARRAAITWTPAPDTYCAVTVTVVLLWKMTAALRVVAQQVPSCRGIDGRGANAR